MSGLRGLRQPIGRGCGQKVPHSFRFSSALFSFDFFTRSPSYRFPQAQVKPRDWSFAHLQNILLKIVKIALRIICIIGTCRDIGVILCRSPCKAGLMIFCQHLAMSDTLEQCSPSDRQGDIVICSRRSNCLRTPCRHLERMRTGESKACR